MSPNGDRGNGEMRNLYVAASLMACLYLFCRPVEAASFTFTFDGQIDGCTGPCGIDGFNKVIIGQFTLYETPLQDVITPYDPVYGYIGARTEFANARWSAKIVEDTEHSEDPLLEVLPIGGLVEQRTSFKRLVQRPHRFCWLATITFG